MQKEYTDNELLEMFLNKGNPNYAFDLIVRKYQRRLYLHIRKLVISHADTNDVLQNTFIKAWRGLPKFRADSELFTWLYRIATNEAFTFLKKKKRRYFIPIIDVEKDLTNTLQNDSYFSGSEIQKKLYEAILQLPKKQRVVFNMRYFDEIPYQKMAKILDTSEGALKASYHHAVKKIEKIMQNT